MPRPHFYPSKQPFTTAFSFLSAFTECFQNVPTSLLVCTDGLLEIRPKKVDVTRWNEVRGTLQGPGFERKKSYKLNRINRKPLVFGEALEDIEGLVDLIRRQL